MWARSLASNHELYSLQQWWSGSPLPSNWVHPSLGTLHEYWQKGAQGVLWDRKMCRVHPIRPKLPEGKVHHNLLFLCLWLLFSMPSPFPFRLPYSFPTFCYAMQQRSHQCWVMTQKQTCLFLEILHTEGFCCLISSIFTCTVDPFLYNSRSCCVDEVAAEHVQADCIIHFGPACLTQWVNKASSVIVYNVKGFVILALQRWKYFPKLSKHPQQCLSVIAIYFARVSHCIWKLPMSTSIILGF